MKRILLISALFFNTAAKAEKGLGFFDHPLSPDSAIIAVNAICSNPEAPIANQLFKKDRVMYKDATGKDVMLHDIFRACYLKSFQEAYPGEINSEEDIIKKLNDVDFRKEFTADYYVNGKTSQYVMLDGTLSSWVPHNRDQEDVAYARTTGKDLFNTFCGNTSTDEESPTPKPRPFLPKTTKPQFDASACAPSATVTANINPVMVNYSSNVNILPTASTGSNTTDNSGQQGDYDEGYENNDGYDEDNDADYDGDYFNYPYPPQYPPKYWMRYQRRGGGGCYFVRRQHPLIDLRISFNKYTRNRTVINNRCHNHNGNGGGGGGGNNGGPWSGSSHGNGGRPIKGTGGGGDQGHVFQLKNRQTGNQQMKQPKQPKMNRQARKPVKVRH